MKANIGIKEENLAVVARSLSNILADEFILALKTRNAHWNLVGPDFFNKHKFFEEQYSQLDEIADGVAERIRTLGHYAPATVKEFLELTHLTEQRRDKNTAEAFIVDLLADHESILIHLRENINGYAAALHDSGTSDYITGLMETHEKMAWMLRAHLG